LGYRRFASGLRVVVEAGMMRIDDQEATAAVLVASLAYYPMVRLLIGHTPGDIERETATLRPGFRTREPVSITSGKLRRIRYHTVLQ
jgi:hypothetical protein